MIKEAIGIVVDGQSLTHRIATSTMKEIMTGQSTPAQIGSLLTALRIKGETVGEIASFATVMKEFCQRIEPKVKGKLLDTCGTGGDSQRTFNVSTAAAFVAAGAGAKVAKHGNRAVSGLCGSADVLESVGVKLDVEPRVVETAISEIGIGFIFAPTFHPSFKFAGPPRREIGIRTVFNLLGPLTNPAGASSQLLGVYDPALTVTLARVLKELGTEEAMVVHGVGGLDEISTSGVTKATRLHGGEIETKELRPRDFGLRPGKTTGGIVSSPAESVRVFVDVLKGGDSGAATDMVLVNAAAAIVVAGLEKELVDGVERARESLSTGAAEGKLRQLIKATKGDDSRLDRLQ